MSSIPPQPVPGRQRIDDGDDMMMRIAAVIVAAGMGLRHTSLRPLPVLAGSTVIKSTTDNLRLAGAELLVVVGGRILDALKRHLGAKNILYISNSAARQTDMFYSARCGLGAVPNEYDLIFFLPSDIPVLNVDSLQQMAGHMAAYPECDILQPCCKGRRGHPVLLRRTAIEQLLAYRGEQGLRGAIESYPGEKHLLELVDPGLYLDVDKAEDFRAFCRYAQQVVLQIPVSCQTEIQLGRGKPFFTSMVAELLRQTDAKHSLSTACAALGISYSKGWKSIRIAETQLGYSLLVSSRGGMGGGHSSLTDEAHELLRRYDALAEEIARFSTERFNAYFG